MRKFLLLYVMLASVSQAQCNFNILPNDVCYPYDTLNIPVSKQSDIIYICGSNAVVYDTLDPASIKYRFVFIHPGSTYHCKTTLSNSSMQIWAKSGSTIIIEPGTNPGFLFNITKEPGAAIFNLSASSVTPSITVCGTITNPVAVSCVPTGINEVQNIISEPPVWPNPTSDKLYINAEAKDKAPVSVSVINQLGEVVLSEEYLNSGKKEISLEKYSIGIYFVRVRSGNFTETKKIALVK